MKILVVDDERTNRYFVAIFAKACHPGAEITEAANGVEGRDKFVEGDFDAVITDFEMPGINGLELLRFIKNSGRDNVRGVLMTGSEDPAVKTGVGELGYRFLKKPFLMEELHTALL